MICLSQKIERNVRTQVVGTRSVDATSFEWRHSFLSMNISDSLGAEKSPDLRTSWLFEPSHRFLFDRTRQNTSLANFFCAPAKTAFARCDDPRNVSESNSNFTEARVDMSILEFRISS
jgi:hypothetical protein